MTDIEKGEENSGADPVPSTPFFLAPLTWLVNIWRAFVRMLKTQSIAAYTLMSRVLMTAVHIPSRLFRPSIPPPKAQPQPDPTPKPVPAPAPKAAEPAPSELPTTPLVFFDEGGAVTDEQLEILHRPTDNSDDVPEVKGRIHSLESMSAVDGPGLRYLVFTQGCPRRCKFCANPDSWETKGGRVSSTKDLAKQVRKCRSYLRPNGGGITCSGGEPLQEPLFVGALFKEVKILGLTTCLDTTGWGTKRAWDAVLPYTDVVLLCLKSFDDDMYFKITETNSRSAVKFAEELTKQNVKFWLRYVMLPGWTDNEFEYSHMEEFVKAHPTCLGIELLPYHRLGVEKWHALGKPYELEGIEPPSHAEVKTLRERFEAKGISVLTN